MIGWGRRRELEDDLRMYRNLLALLPYCVRVRTVPVLPPRPRSGSVVYFQPRRGQPGRRIEWS